MPNGDGAFLAESVNNYSEKKACPFFIMTANLEYNYEELNKRGVKVILSKPFDFDQFLAIAHFFLNTFSNQDYSRKNPRVDCQLSLALNSIDNKSIKMINLSPEGFLLQLKNMVKIHVGDKISFSSQQNQINSSSIIKGEAECRWVLSHHNFTLAGFSIISLTNRNNILELYNQNILEGNLH